MLQHTTINVEGYKLPYLLYLDNTDTLKSGHWLFHIHTKDNWPGLDLAEAFKHECYEIPRSLNWFHQGGCLPGNRRSPWHMFEFWSKDEAGILEEALKIADNLGLELQIGNISRADLNFIQGGGFE